jgi:hypothetical protein
MVSEMQSDKQPFAPLGPPSLTPPVDAVAPLVATAPRAELAESNNIRKPFRR